MKEKNPVNLREAIKILIAAISCIVLYGIIGCPIKALTGISCAGCGMTRALLAISKGHVKEAFYYHPLFWTVPVCGIIYLIRYKIPKKIKMIIMLFLIIMFLIVYVIRLLDHDCNIVKVDVKEGLIYRLFYKIYEYQYL